MCQRSSNEDVTCSDVVQRATDEDEVFDLRLACVRAIVRVIPRVGLLEVLKRIGPL